jgi:hypothetical protein
MDRVFKVSIHSEMHSFSYACYSYLCYLSKEGRMILGKDDVVFLAGDGGGCKGVCTSRCFSWAQTSFRVDQL